MVYIVIHNVFNRHIFTVLYFEVRDILNRTKTVVPENKYLDYFIQGAGQT